MISNLSLRSYADEIKKEIVVTEKLSNNKNLLILDFYMDESIPSKYDLKNIISDVLKYNLSKYHDINIIKNDILKKYIDNSKIIPNNHRSSDFYIKMGKIINSKYVVYGYISKKDDYFEISTKLVDTNISKVIYDKSIKFLDLEDFLKSLDYISSDIAYLLDEKIIMTTSQINIVKYKKAKNPIFDKNQLFYGAIWGSLGFISLCIFAGIFLKFPELP